MQRISLGILGSTRGTALQAIIDAIAEKRLPADISVIVSNKKDALILEKARQQGLSAFFLDPANIERETYEKKLSMLFQENAVDLIVLIGYMRILSDNFVRLWKNRIINIHPSLLPDFAGGMDKQVHQAVLDANKTETGCTVHYVTEELDAGPILVQLSCPVFHDDTVETLKARVQSLEGDALVMAILKIRDGQAI